MEFLEAELKRRGSPPGEVKYDAASVEKLLKDIPRDESVDTLPFATELAGRPLSDVAFVIREGARTYVPGEEIARRSRIEQPALDHREIA